MQRGKEGKNKKKMDKPMRSRGVVGEVEQKGQELLKDFVPNYAVLTYFFTHHISEALSYLNGIEALEYKSCCLSMRFSEQIMVPFLKK